MTESECIGTLPKHILHMHVSLSVLGADCHNAARMMRLENEAIPSIMEFERIAAELLRVGKMLTKHAKAAKALQQEGVSEFDRKMQERRDWHARVA